MSPRIYEEGGPPRRTNKLLRRDQIPPSTFIGQGLGTRDITSNQYTSELCAGEPKYENENLSSLNYKI